MPRNTKPSFLTATAENIFAPLLLQQQAEAEAAVEALKQQQQQQAEAAVEALKLQQEETLKLHREETNLEHPLDEDESNQIGSLGISASSSISNTQLASTSMFSGPLSKTMLGLGITAGIAEAVLLLTKTIALSHPAIAGSFAAIALVIAIAAYNLPKDSTKVKRARISNQF